LTAPIGVGGFYGKDVVALVKVSGDVVGKHAAHSAIVVAPNEVAVNVEVTIVIEDGLNQAR
jgi:hypothetical protein